MSAHEQAHTADRVFLCVKIEISEHFAIPVLRYSKLADTGITFLIISIDKITSRDNFMG